MTAVLEVSGLKQHFQTRAGTVHAVNDVSFAIGPGETVGLVGESGCGKSSVARSIVGLTKPSGGSIKLLGTEVAGKSPAQLKPHRAALQMIFQNPSAALNPRLSVGRLIEEPLVVHRRGNRAERTARVHDLLAKVGLRKEMALRFPHELSGGQRQRVCIARALALSPSILLCDEAVSALDVSVQAQVVNLLRDLQAELGISLLFISHGLSLTRYISHRILIMYLGKIVEEASSDAVFQDPLHPYTQALIAAAPTLDVEPAESPAALLQGELPSPLSPPSGCHFHTRCPYAVARCASEAPNLREVSVGRKVACHLVVVENGRPMSPGASR